MSTKIPVKQYESFTQDQAFEQTRKLLEKSTEKKWKEIIEKKPQALTSPSGKSILAVAMDSIFFHPDRFEILVDARGFRPEELKCTVSNNGSIEVTAERQESSDSNSKRVLSLSRNYNLPQNIQSEQGNCLLSAEGILVITAPWMK